ncbi:response regulator [Geminicoccus roseus]|uniref:response regulator n=1 Tax=Geminicoccus roseus TaxID=404900 RepID=UPI000428325F|nr:response regulator [Geminicoccus roseus]
MSETAITILVVEDSPTQALRLQITLEQQGWATAWSASAEEALERLNDELPDLMVVDLHLPGISGDELTRRVRMNMRTRNLPVLMLTDSESVEAQRRGFESGADDYVPKSSPSDVLLLRIGNLLRGRSELMPAGSGMSAFRRGRTLVAVDVLTVGEGQAAVADRLAMHLKHDHHDVTVLASQEAVLTAVAAEPFDCVIVVMSDKMEESLAFCSRLDLVRRRQDQPFHIIALDGSSGIHQVMEVLQSGADDFVDARGGLQILSARIGAYLRRKLLQEESARIATEERARRQELEQARQLVRTAESRAALTDALEESNAELAAANARLREIQAELTAARDNAERAAQTKAEFLATMSHEIRTPMTGVLGMADLLAAEKLTDTQRHYVETIRRSGSHLLSIINDILDFSRIEAGKLDLEHIDFAPETALDHVVSLLQPQVTERGLVLRQEVEASPGLIVQGDPTRVRQVLVNLVGNALKFTSEGEVVIAMRECAVNDDQVRLRFSVRDTGIGIPAEQQAKLFSAFVQADRSTSRHYGGSGLGLAICRQLVEAMSGTIGVESSEGEGSLFWFELPMSRGSSERLANIEGAVTEIRPLRVLVADDVAVNRELVGTMLTRHGHVVECAENGRDAVEMVSHGSYDVVLMDVQMPVMDGIEASRRIRQLPRSAAAVPILALTANVMASERDRCLAAGMNRCLVKPIVWTDLFAALAAIAAGVAPPEIAEDQRERAGGTVDLLEQPLLDRARVQGMSQKMSPEMVRQMLGRGLSGAADSIAKLRDGAGDAEVLSKEAHRLRGTAGTFGLTRLSVLAGLVEDASSDPARGRQGEVVAELIALLGSVLEETRHAVADALEASVAG